MKRFSSILTLCCALFAVAPASWADYPERPIEVVVPYGPGGDVDLMARLVTKYLTPVLGQSLPVVNINGASGAVGGRKVLDSKPDGYTALFQIDGIMVGTAVGIMDHGWSDFEFTSICGWNAGTFVAVRNDSKWKTLKELMDDSAKNPGKITLAANAGSTTMFIALQLNQAGGAFNVVNHGGGGQRLTALLGGHVDVIPNDIGSIQAYIKSGDIRVLANLADPRTPYTQEFPTVKELGYNAVSNYYYYFLFPKGTPKAILDKFTDALEKVVTTNTEYAEELKKVMMQAPYFVKGPEALKIMQEQDKLITGTFEKAGAAKK
jgi:tripartite-type tricarboxylate transporter receptor subunit TctC